MCKDLEFGILKPLLLLWKITFSFKNIFWVLGSLCSAAQSYPPLCDPVDCSLPGFSVRGIFSGETTGVGCHFLLQGSLVYTKKILLSYKIYNNEMIVTYSTGSPSISNPQLSFWVFLPPGALDSMKCHFIKVSFIYNASKRELILGSHLTLLLTGWDVVRSSRDPWGGTGDKQTAELNVDWLKWTEREMILKCIVCTLPGFIYFSIIFGCAQRHLGVKEMKQAASTCSFLRNYRLFLKSTRASQFLVSQNPLTGRIVCCTRKAKCTPGSCAEPLNCAKASVPFNIKFRQCFS